MPSATTNVKNLGASAAMDLTAPSTAANSLTLTTTKTTTASKSSIIQTRLAANVKLKAAQQRVSLSDSAPPVSKLC